MLNSTLQLLYLSNHRRTTVKFKYYFIFFLKQKLINIKARHVFKIQFIIKIIGGGGSSISISIFRSLSFVYVQIIIDMLKQTLN